jgi:hypothetical protein
MILLEYGKMDREKDRCRFINSMENIMVRSSG